jgi:hypothetical protein
MTDRSRLGALARKTNEARQAGRYRIQRRGRAVAYLVFLALAIGGVVWLRLRDG